MDANALNHYLEQAIFSLCQLNVSGPPVVTLGRAMEAVMAAKQIVEEEVKANAAEAPVSGEYSTRDTD